MLRFLFIPFSVQRNNEFPCFPTDRFKPDNAFISGNRCAKWIPKRSRRTESPSHYQSPLSTDSSPSPVVPFRSLLEDRTRKLSPSELPSERGIITFTLSYDPVSLALQVGMSAL
ncbi:hypothetical protein COOONC_03072 [Cooperia oncophora]